MQLNFRIGGTDDTQAVNIIVKQYCHGMKNMRF
jgi:hypothetical protein